eukprot:scaffold114541_cov33-Tisochrysis_lutea.AAC.1
MRQPTTGQGETSQRERARWPGEGHVHHPLSSGEKWPAGALLPETATLSKATSWAWRTLRAATEEFQLVVDGVIDDLEGLGHNACSGALIASTRKVSQASTSRPTGSNCRAYGDAARTISKRPALDFAEDDLDEQSMNTPPPLPLEDLLFGASDDVAADMTPALLPSTVGHEPVGRASLPRVPSHDFEIINFEDEVLWEDTDGDDF